MQRRRRRHEPLHLRMQNVQERRQTEWGAWHEIYANEQRSVERRVMRAQQSRESEQERGRARARAKLTPTHRKLEALIALPAGAATLWVYAKADAAQTIAWRERIKQSARELCSLRVCECTCVCVCVVIVMLGLTTWTCIGRALSVGVGVGIGIDFVTKESTGSGSAVAARATAKKINVRAINFALCRRRRRRRCANKRKQTNNNHLSSSSSSSFSCIAKRSHNTQRRRSSVLYALLQLHFVCDRYAAGAAVTVTDTDFGRGRDNGKLHLALSLRKLLFPR